MLNPCCCISPRIGTFIFAILDLVSSVLYSLSVVKAIVDRGFHYEMLGEVILCALLVLLALLLLFGAIQNSQEKIRLYLILWLVFLVLAVVFQTFHIYQSHLGYRESGSIVAFVLFLYQIWVVYAYLTELRYGPGGLTYCPSQIV